MFYRRLTLFQFRLVTDTARRRCEKLGLKTIVDFKQIGNEIIDQLEKGEITIAQLVDEEECQLNE